MKDIFIVWVERQMLDRYKTIDRIRTGHFIKVFHPDNTDLLYCYYNRYNIITIPADMIIEIDGKVGEYRKQHGSYMEIIEK